MYETRGTEPRAVSTVSHAVDGLEQLSILSFDGAPAHAAPVDDRRTQVAALRAKGLSTPAIGRELGWSHETVRQDLKALGLDSSAQGRWNGNGQLLSLTKAARRLGLNRHTLAAAATAGRVRSRRIEAPGLGPNGVGFLFDVDELQEDLERLPACREDGCRRPALGPSGGCEAHGHVFTGARARGVKRPDIGPAISAGKTGKARPDQAERMRDSWARGVGAAAAAIERGRGATRRVWKLRWAPKPGPSKSYSQAEADHVRALKAEHPDWGIRTIARSTGFSVKVVRGILSG